MDGTGYPDRLAGDEFPLLVTEGPRAKAIETASGWRDREITSQFVRLNQRVIAKAAKGIGTSTGTSMQDSLSNLRHFLAQ